VAGMAPEEQVTRDAGRGTWLPVDEGALTPPVRRALGSDTVEVADWHCEAVHGGLMGAAVYRLWGSARDRGRTPAWSLILKVVRPSPSCAAWQREPLAFASGLLDELPGRLAAPGCFGVVEGPEDERWIWLEEVRGQPGTEWCPERLVGGARHLGQFNGAYLAGEPLPSAPWLARGMLRSWMARLAPSVEQLRLGLGQGDPLLRRGWPADVARGLFRLWAEGEAFTEALDRLPQTLCHHDANARNLIARRDPDGGEQTVAIDWAFAGIGPPGYDIVPLCGEMLPSFRLDLDQAQDLAEGIFEGYLEGLRDAGWRGEGYLARLGFSAALSLRYGVCGGPANLSDLLDERRRVVPEQRWGRTIEEIMDRWAGCARFMLGLAEEARELRARLT
jgi:hypothetical protein